MIFALLAWVAILFSLAIYSVTEWAHEQHVNLSNRIKALEGESQKEFE